MKLLEVYRAPAFYCPMCSILFWKAHALKAKICFTVWWKPQVSSCDTLFKNALSIFHSLIWWRVLLCYVFGNATNTYERDLFPHLQAPCGQLLLPWDAELITEWIAKLQKLGITSPHCLAHPSAHIAQDWVQLGFDWLQGMLTVSLDHQCQCSTALTQWKSVFLCSDGISCVLACLSVGSI